MRIGRLLTNGNCPADVHFSGALHLHHGFERDGLSLPVIVLAYEVLFQRSGKWESFLPLLIPGALTLLFILGKTTGEGAMTAMEACRPVLSWARFSDANTRFLNTLFYTDRFTIFRGAGSVVPVALPWLAKWPAKA
jgi:hypothetical protein